jgi:hypothetical protein
MQYEEGLSKLATRAKLATIALWAFIAVSALTVGVEALEAANGAIYLETEMDTRALAFGLTYLAYTLAFVVSIVLVGLWIHRAHANLRESGADGLEFTPGWAVGWYFVPFANLVMPFRAMRELWNASRGEHDFFGGAAPSAVKVWWAAWIAGNILSAVGSRILLLGEGNSGSVTVGNAVGAAGTVGVLIAAVLLRTIIARVTAAQRGGLASAGVFA